MKILFKYPSRSRPEQFLRGLKSIQDNVSSDNYQILVSLDYDDETMERSKLPPECFKNNVMICYGQSESKIHAINRDMDQAKGWDVLVCMSDDMIFKVKGFDDTIREAFMYDKEDPQEGNDLDRFIHFPDGNRYDLCTMSIIGRDYYDRDKYIYHPDYKSLYCDNEAQEVAKERGCYKFVDKQIFEHLHPAYGKAVFDRQYQITESIGNSVDRETYNKRKEMSFGL